MYYEQAWIVKYLFKNEKEKNLKKQQKKKKNPNKKKTTLVIDFTAM